MEVGTNTLNWFEWGNLCIPNDKMHRGACVYYCVYRQAVEMRMTTYNEKLVQLLKIAPQWNKTNTARGFLTYLLFVYFHHFTFRRIYKREAMNSHLCIPQSTEEVICLPISK